MKFAANLTMMFTEVPFMERFREAKKAGFRYVEYMFPYDYEAAAIKQQLDEHGLQQVLFNLPAGDFAAGERGIAANPARVEEFKAGVPKAIAYAKTLGVKQLNCMAGKKAAGYSDEEQWQTLVGNVAYAAAALEQEGLTLLIEPINFFDIQGFFLNRTDEAAKLIEAAGRGNVRIQYDLYHAQRMEGELTATMRRYFDKIGHVQIADNPGRHQPGTGEMNYPFLFKALEELGYAGYIGLEYLPSPDSHASLGWVKEYGYSL